MPLNSRRGRTVGWSALQRTGDAFQRVYFWDRAEDDGATNGEQGNVSLQTD